MGLVTMKRDFDRDVNLIMGGKVLTADRKKVQQLWSPLMFVDTMDHVKNNHYSSIHSTAKCPLMAIHMWFEANKYSYCGGYDRVYCEPELATLFALSCPDWNVDIYASPFCVS